MRRIGPLKKAMQVLAVILLSAASASAWMQRTRSSTMAAAVCVGLCAPGAVHAALARNTPVPSAVIVEAVVYADRDPSTAAGKTMLVTLSDENEGIVAGAKVPVTADMFPMRLELTERNLLTNQKGVAFNKDASALKVAVKICGTVETSERASTCVDMVGSENSGIARLTDIAGSIVRLPATVRWQ